MRGLRRGGLVVVSAAAAFAVVTWIALESREVVVLRTFGSGGTPRETRVWVAEVEGALWIEAATPERSWYLDIRDEPRIELVRGGEARAWRATPLPGAKGHARIRSLLRAKYGWADAWVGLLQDTSDSIAVRLDPIE